MIINEPFQIIFQAQMRNVLSFVRICLICSVPSIHCEENVLMFSDFGRNSTKHLTMSDLCHHCEAKQLIGKNIQYVIYSEYNS